MSANLKFLQLLEEFELSHLSRFKAKAVVDWLDLQITTATPTNFPTIQGKIGRILDSSSRIWVKPIDRGDGGAATRFVLRLHDVARRADLVSLVTRLEAHFPFASPPEIIAVEVSIDFYSRRSLRTELEALFMRIKLTRPDGGSNELESHVWTDRVDTLRQLRSDATLVSKEGDVLRRYYLKDRDRGEQLVDPAMHRVRAEVGLKGTKIPMGMGTDWATGRARFESLTPYFSFRTILADAGDGGESPGTPAALVSKYKIDRARRIGVCELAPAKNERRKYSKLTQADSGLKSRIRDALRDLTRRFYAEIPGKTKGSATEIAEESVKTLITT